MWNRRNLAIYICALLAALMLVACGAEEAAEPAEQTDETPFDKAAFIANFTQDMNVNYGDAGGSEIPLEWYELITEFDVDYDKKTIYAITAIPTSDDDVSWDITNALITTKLTESISWRRTS